MNPALLIIAKVAIIVGMIWIGQGTGVFPYPRSSFMINQRPWAYRGAAVVVCGVIAVIYLRRH